MQIGDNLYVDIKVKNDPKRGILEWNRLIALEITETAGASLPYICFSFATTNGDWAKKFIKNNTIEIRIGETEEKSNTFEINLLDDSFQEDRAHTAYIVSGGGFIGGNDFMVDKSRCKAYKGNSLTVVKQLIEDYPKLKKVQTNITNVKENIVTWRQTYGVSNSFLMETILHMNLSPSFPLCAFDKWGTFHIYSFKELRKEGPKWIFIPKDTKTVKEKDKDKGKVLYYLNNVNVSSNQLAYNLYSGYNKVSEVDNATSGVSTFSIDTNEVIMATSEEANKMDSGNRVRLNKIQSDNVHRSYMEAFAFNTNKLMALSSIQSCLRLVGYYPELKSTDIVQVRLDSGKHWFENTGGYYVIEAVRYSAEAETGAIYTDVFLTKDNVNNIENAIVKKKKKVNVTKKAIQRLSNTVARARTVMATAQQIMDGTFIDGVTSFLTSTRYNLLRMFSVAGVMIDFNSQSALIQSLLCAGNAIMNVLLDSILPEPIAFTLRDFLIDKPFTGLKLLYRYIDEYVPFGIRGIVTDIVDALFGVHDALNSIAEDNGITARRKPEPVVTNADTEFEEENNRVGEILEAFEDNTSGVDIPLPIISLTEEQELMPDDDLKEYIANETIANLTDLGYLEDFTDSELDEFKETLVGDTEYPLSGTESGIQIIDKINRNAGSSFMYRFWGTYGASSEALYAWSYDNETVYTKTREISEYTRLYNNDYSPYTEGSFEVRPKKGGSFVVVFTPENKEALEDEEKNIYSNALLQLTDFYINKGYKDRYRTLPCTKLISATGNKRLYFACPQREQNIKFYINSRRVYLESFPIDLGYKDSFGNKLMYNVYFTSSGYNSNSTMLEIRQG